MKDIHVSELFFLSHIKTIIRQTNYIESKRKTFFTIKEIYMYDTINTKVLRDNKFLIFEFGGGQIPLILVISFIIFKNPFS